MSETIIPQHKTPSPIKKKFTGQEKRFPPTKYDKQRGNLQIFPLFTFSHLFHEKTDQIKHNVSVLSGVPWACVGVKCEV